MTSIRSRLIFSALGVALLATPAFAAPNDQLPSPQYYTPSAVIVDGVVIGADPDSRIRFELKREWDSLHGE